MKKISELSVVFILLVFSASQSFAAHQYRVTSVALDDQLNVRKGPPESIEHKTILGAFSPNATGIIGTGKSTLIGGQRWFEVFHRKSTGWVNGKYLELLTHGAQATLWSKMDCFGTEPFWSLRINGRTAEYDAMSKPEGATARKFSISRIKGANRPDVRRLRLKPVKGGSQMTALLTHRPWCSDGMSDFDFAFEIFLWESDKDINVMQGCCSILH